MIILEETLENIKILSERIYSLTNLYCSSNIESTDMKSVNSMINEFSYNIKIEAECLLERL